MTRIACVACLDVRRSVHTTTFLRAVELAQSELLPDNVELRLFDDGASADGARQAIQQVMDWKADAVVGHFASASADVAAPYYAQHQRPLFLPAATAHLLTEHATTYRLCDSDKDYGRWLQQLMIQQAWLPALITHDGSLHGASVAGQIDGAMETVFPQVLKTNTTVFSGSYSASLDYAVTWAKQSTEQARLILTDDAWSAALVPELLARGVSLPARHIYVAGLQPLPVGDAAMRIRAIWRRRWGDEPGCYFWETLAALEVACRFPDIPSQTVMGQLRFDALRESRPGSYRLWQAGVEGLRRVDSLDRVEV
ncbi:ABC transporter substrate-binding protein [Dickeya chrysanthemi]|uniref:ABC transporter substrate-binding protein n=1 Tax=Dickeya chrysanthemi TaxID=556 RepID=UPI00301A4A1E